jgi:hypothetical protein
MNDTHTHHKEDAASAKKTITVANEFAAIVLNDIGLN